MKEKDRFLIIRGKKVKYSLNARMTVIIGIVVFLGWGLAYLLHLLLEWLIPAAKSIPVFVQMGFFVLFIVVFATRLISKIFFNPIKDINDGMQKIADGEFNTRLQTKSKSVEIQEMFAGFNMMAKELNSTEILQTDFVSNVSHEIKTPINAIEGYSTLLQGSENLGEEQREYVDKILFNTNRLSTLVSNILLLSKIENQSIQTKREPYSLDEQIRESIVELEATWEQKEIVFEVELENVEYIGNETMMRHVWNNLIGNAIKFSPRGGTIRLFLRDKEDKFIFVVEDEGPGISEDAQKHLFDKFYQEDTSHKGEGNGLGLALVKRILQIEGSDILAENIETGGCRFIITLYKNK